REDARVHRCQGIGITGWDIVLVQETPGDDVDGKVGVELGAALRQLGYRMERDSALSLRHEETLQGLVCRLLGHEAGIGVIAAFLMTAGNLKSLAASVSPQAVEPKRMTR